tara:strand:- start:135 stop:311 length:177 start_codon:yes stop_codon:yes gene_type:complete
MRVEKRKSDGAFIVSDIIDKYYTKRVFMGYTKRQAISIFKKEIKQEYLDYKYHSQFLG